jgi:hypothetical protein
MSTPTLSHITHAVSQFMHRFHVTIFVVFVVGGLSLATLFLQRVITATPQADAGTTGSASTFSKSEMDTMERIRNLHTTDDKSSLTLPSGRINPFRTS